MAPTPQLSKVFRVARQYRVDILLLMLLLIIGYGLCRSYHNSLDETIHYSGPNTMALLGPAVFFAAGQGLGVHAPDSIPGLKEFITLKTSEFDISKIPDNVQTVPAQTPFELTNIYYLYTVGWFWRLFGVSLRSLSIFAAVWCALSAGAFYALLRNGLNKGFSFVGVLLIISSPAFLHSTLMFRDFAKTPIILLILCLLLRLILSKHSNLRIVVIAIALGVLTGLGMGFRQDIILCVPWAAALLLFAPNRDRKHVWKTRVLSILLFFLFFVPLAKPAFTGGALEGNQASVHGFFQGLTDEVEEQLDFGGASYNFLAWSDSGLYGQANTYARRMNNTDSFENPHAAVYKRAHEDPNAPFMINPGLFYTGATYANIQRQLLRKALFIFPADIITRAWQSTISFYSVPFKMLRNVTLIQDQYPTWLKGNYYFHHFVTRLLSYVGLIAMLILLCSVAAFRFKEALLLTGMLLCFTGALSINFELRLTPYLFFVPYFGVLFCLERSFGRFRKKQIHKSSVSEDTSDKKNDTLHVFDLLPMVKVSVFLCLILIIAIIPLVILQLWQSRQTLALTEQLQSMPLEAVPTEVSHHDGCVLIAPDRDMLGFDEAAQSLPPGETAWFYGAVVFDTRGRDLPITLEYDPERVFNDFTQPITIWGVEDKKQGRVTFFFPVYETTTLYTASLFESYLETVYIPAWQEKIKPDLPFEAQPLWKRSRFLGISMPESCSDSFQGFYRLTDLDALSLLIFVQVPEDRSFFRDHKMGPWERWLRGYSGEARLCAD